MNGTTGSGWSFITGLFGGEGMIALPDWAPMWSYRKRPVRRGFRRKNLVRRRAVA